MAQCSKCGSPLNDTQKFCGVCGTPVEAAQAPEQDLTAGAAATVGGAAAAGAVAAEAAAPETDSAAQAEASDAAEAASAEAQPAPSATPSEATTQIAPPPPMPTTPAAPAPPPAYTPPPGYPPQGPPQGYAPQGYQAQGYQPQGYPPPQGYGPPPAYGPGGAYPAGAWQPPRKSRKGLWIGLTALVLVLAIACILVFVVFWDQVSGEGGTTADAEQTLAAAWTAAQDLSDMSGTYEASITLETNTSQMSPEEQQMVNMFLGQPITASGTFAFTESPMGLDLTMGMGLFGQNINAGVRMLDGQPWISFLGQWYEAPPDLEQQMADSGIDVQAGAIRDLLAGLSIDPTSWLKDVKKAGEEDVDGTATVHYSGSPDFVQMMIDLNQLMQSPEAQGLLDLGGSLGADSGLGVEIPTAEELADLEAQLDAMIQDATVDLWIAKDDTTMRKMSMDMRIVPPSEDLGGDGALSGVGEMLKSIGVTATITLDDPDQQVKIEAPGSALPFTALEDALDSELGILGLLLGGGAGMGF